MTIVLSRCDSISMPQLSSGSGWQKGISSCVRFAAMTPATMAVSNTGPFFVRCPAAASARATGFGSLTIASALASRKVAFFAPTSTMVGRFAASRWVSLGMYGSTADVVHLDLVQVGVAHRGAQLAVAIAPPRPGAADQLVEFLVRGAGAQRP